MRTGKPLAVWLAIIWMTAVTVAHFAINLPYYQDKMGVFVRFLARAG